MYPLAEGNLFSLSGLRQPHRSLTFDFDFVLGLVADLANPLGAVADQCGVAEALPLSGGDQGDPRALVGSTPEWVGEVSYEAENEVDDEG